MDESSEINAIVEKARYELNDNMFRADRPLTEGTCQLLEELLKSKLFEIPTFYIREVAVRIIQDLTPIPCEKWHDFWSADLGVIRVGQRRALMGIAVEIEQFMKR